MTSPDQIEIDFPDFEPEPVFVAGELVIEDDDYFDQGDEFEYDDYDAAYDEMADLSE